MQARKTRLAFVPLAFFAIGNRLHIIEPIWANIGLEATAPILTINGDTVVVVLEVTAVASCHIHVCVIVIVFFFAITNTGFAMNDHFPRDARS